MDPGDGPASGELRVVGDLRYAGVPERAVAYAVDMVLVLAVSMTLSVVLALLLLGSTAWVEPWSDPVARMIPGNIERYLPYLVLTNALGTGLEAAYFTLLWSGATGSTFAMRLLRLRVADAVTGMPLTRGRAFRRWVAMGSWIGLLSLLPPLSGLLIPLFLAWPIVLVAATLRSQRRQGLHDLAGGSVVVERLPALRHPLAIGCLALAFLGFTLASGLAFVGFWAT